MAKNIEKSTKSEVANYYLTHTYYAVWANTTSNITYELNEGTVTGTNATSYNYIVTSKNIHLISPKKEYNTFVGWELTASKDTITNWETKNGESVFYSVENPEEGLDLNIGTHFGDITLTAVYERKVSNIEIIVNNSNCKNQYFIFEISGTPSDGIKFNSIKVVIACDENGYGSATIKGIPIGTYNITMENNWTWRFAASSQNIAIDNSQEVNTVSFKEFSIKNIFWLNGYYKHIINT